ncbi:hypothetical protein [Roseisalinus antarcticus]|uniref:hypothetical protein n=1 Tax=Roseisalinus antarcticus TaxID=254357 RepID=UPI001179ACA4|nr:hypothetical protein [Roseisalinus antarcticus]
MRSPKRDDLVELQTSDPEDFKRFLISGFRGFVEEGKGRHAFGVAAPFIGRNGSMALDLEDVHDCLEAAEQLAFREGCIRALEDTVHIDSSTRDAIAVNLINLAGRVRASRLAEVLPKIVRLIALEIESERQREVLYRAAFDACMAAATPSVETRDCIFDLAEQRKMPSRVAPTALLRLVEVEPKKVAAHLAALWPQLDDALGWSPVTGDLEQDTAEEEMRMLARERLLNR